MVIQSAGKLVFATGLAIRNVPQSLGESVIELIRLLAGTGNADLLAPIILELMLQSLVAGGIQNRGSNGLPVAVVNLWCFVHHQNLGTLSTECGHGEGLDDTAILHGTDALRPGNTHRVAATRHINLTQHIGISHEDIRNLLKHQRGLFARAGDHRDSASRVQDSQSNTADSHKPRLASATVLNDVYLNVVADGPCLDLLNILELDLEVFLNKNIKVRPPVPDLLCECLKVPLFTPLDVEFISGSHNCAPTALSIWR